MNLTPYIKIFPLFLLVKSNGLPAVKRWVFDPLGLNSFPNSSPSFAHQIWDDGSFSLPNSDFSFFFYSTSKVLFLPKIEDKIYSLSPSPRQKP